MRRFAPKPFRRLTHVRADRVYALSGIISMINIGDWISKWSHLQPHKRAIIAEDRPLTYQEVNLRVNQLCHFLLRLGVQKGDRISVLLYNCHPYIEIFFALSKIGAILVPLNWRLAGPELEFIIKDSGSRVLIFDPEFTEIVTSLRPIFKSFPRPLCFRWLPLPGLDKGL